MEYISIQEVADLYQKHISTIYKAIQRSSLNTIEVLENSKKVIKVLKSDIVRLYGEPVEEVQRSSSNFEERSNEFFRIQMKQVIEEFFQEKQTQLMKPLEEQALYRVGRLEELVKHLEAEKETIRTDYEALKEEIKVLPDLQEVERLKQEKEDQAKKLLEQSENIRILQKEKEVIMDLREQADTEKEVIMDLREQADTEKEKLIESHKEAEEKHLSEIEELKKQLEEEKKDKQYIEKRLQEELRPWWKKLF